MLLDQNNKSSDIKEKLIAELRNHFRPEFLNRLDETLVFHSLEMDDLIKIVDIQLKDFSERLKVKNITFDATKGAKEYLAKVGYDPVFGARPLKRAIVKELETPISRMLIAGEINDNSTIKVDKKDDGLDFSVEKSDL